MQGANRGNLKRSAIKTRDILEISFDEKKDERRKEGRRRRGKLIEHQNRPQVRPRTHKQITVTSAGQLGRREKDRDCHREG